MLKNIGVYCGSSSGTRPEYVQAARQLGALIAKRGQTLVYGGGRVGLMGEIARAVMEAGGRVIGIIPKHLEAKEVGYAGITELQVVGSMHERKAKIIELSDAFIAMPGGLGTLDELAEVLTWGQLGLHSKPCGLLNVDHYYDHLEAFFNHACQEQFIDSGTRNIILMEAEPEALLNCFETYQAPQHDKAAWALERLKHKQ